MDRVQKTLLLFMVVAIPAAAPPFFASTPPNLCFNAGTVTYQLAPNASAPDYRVRIDNAAAQPDLRVALVDRAETADYVLVDDASGDGHPCVSAGQRRMIKLVPDTADLTISVSREADGADVKLFVHSAHVGHQDAAALFAVMRRAEIADQLADNR